jgi:hypothetical protein
MESLRQLKHALRSVRLTRFWRVPATGGNELGRWDDIASVMARRMVGLLRRVRSNIDDSGLFDVA